MVVGNVVWVTVVGKSVVRNGLEVVDDGLEVVNKANIDNWDVFEDI